MKGHGRMRRRDFLVQLAALAAAFPFLRRPAARERRETELREADYYAPHGLGG